ncbi:uncharacterized protein LOC113856506 [Abrus precatorius]|uniref:Uncharacterized protein LOC113856506 n=1 Tax=Abrus precatorius TaxID=3816 RepID=A0A8B8KK01_ABRPR|nr:uncharacterized protein LOC113856506 [Abrus precatorius]
MSGLSVNLIRLWCFTESSSMILKDLMEEKQLNFNQPLLSVRRFSSTVTSETDNKRNIDNSIARLQPAPSYKSELNSGPVRHAGTVPFIWEKAPGRPKDESKLQTQAIGQPPITPNIPPGRVSKIKEQDSGRVLTLVKKNSQNVATLVKKVTKYDESSKEETKEKESSDSDDGNEAYVDALDTLSRAESFFMSCSVSGLSGWDEKEVQPFGSFSSEQEDRNFMIDRFLPAAKAMISEAPHYASKKALVGQEQQKQIKKDVTLNQHRPKALTHYNLDIIGKEESEDESDDCDESENYTTTVCSLFPRFCLLNPVTGLRMVDKVQRNAVHGMQAKSDASHTESTKEHGRTPNWKKSIDSHSGFTEEKEVLGIHVKSKLGTDPHQRGCNNLVSCESTQRDSSYESPIVEKTLHVDSVHKVKSQTNHIGGDIEALRTDSGIYNNPSIDSSCENSKRLDVMDVKAALQPESSGNSINDMKMEMKKNSKKVYIEKQGLTKAGNQQSDLYQDLVVISSPTKCTLASSKIGNNGKIDLESQYFMKLGHPEISDTSCFRLPLVLPSLKAPSESWLKRILPTISKRNINSRSNLMANSHARSQTHKTPSPYPKWETIVKSSNVYHGHLQLPEELRTLPPEA